MPLTIDLFNPYYSRYLVLHHFTNKLHQALHRQNPSCRLLTLDKLKPQLLLQALKKSPPDCTLTFNAMPHANGEFFADLIKIPHLSCLVDSPATLFSLINGSIEILEKTKYSLFSFVDRDSSQVLKEIGFENTFFFPHAIERELVDETEQERIYDILALNSPIDFKHEEHTWSKTFNPTLQDALKNASEIVLKDPKISNTRAFAKEMRLLKPDNTLSKEIVKYATPLLSLERYTRGYDRYHLINNITCAKVELFGTSHEDKDWSRYFPNRPNLVVHPPISFEKALQTMKRSKIVLNSNSWINDGLHERLLSAMASGALVITTRTPYLEENFIEGEEILFYDLNHWDKIDTLIADHLANDEKRKAIARQGQLKVKRLHTWDNRADELQQTLPSFFETIKQAS